MADGPAEIGDVLVVGGGDVGLLTALCVRQFNPEIELTVVDDFESDPPEVGKSTYEDITAILYEVLEIPAPEFISEVKPIWKGSVYFRDWCGREPFHYPFDLRSEFPNALTPRFSDRAYHYYDRKRDDPDLRTVNEAMVEEGKSAVSFNPSKGRGNATGFDNYTHAYHLDLTRFNAYLEGLCADRGIELVDDTIEAVDVDGDRIERVASADTLYQADLYVDATGFHRALKRELDDTFLDFGLPLDSALSAKFERPLSEAVPATVIESGEYGWFWQIDTYEFRDVGYVFASEFVTEDEAAAEFAEHCDGAVSRGDMSKHAFTSGYYEHPLQGNCLTIGNAVGFIEPLQSTALTANAQSALKLSHLLSAHGGIVNDAMRETYNAWASRLWESIYEFIAVHYRHAPGDGEFWEAMRSIPISDRLATLVETYDRRGFDAGFRTNSGIDPIENEKMQSLEVFTPLSFYAVMYKMGADSAFYEENAFSPSDAVEKKLAEQYESMEAEAEDLLTIEEMYRGVLPEISGNRGPVPR